MLRSADLLDGPNFGTVADSGVSPAGKIVVGIDHGPNGPVATIPDVHLLFNADYKRAGPDLILTGPDGKTAIVPDYFSSDKHATLLSPNGAMLTPDVVQALAGPQAPGQFAQATPAQNDAEAVGRVATVAGNCTILRNGVAITVNAGDAIHKGDVLQTVSGKMGVTFNDGSTLNLTENTRLVVNEFVFDPNGSGNKELLNIVQGSLTFISGQIAHNGDMTIDTPVATMGIRGTVGGVTGVTAEMAQMWITQSATGADVFNKNGVLLGHIAQDGPMLVFHAAQVPLQVIVDEVQKDAQQVAYELSALQAIIATQAIGQQLIQQFFQPNNPNPQSTDHPHTQIQLEFLNSPNHSADLGGVGGTDTSLGGTSIEVQVTTIQFDPVGNVIEDTTVTVPVTLPVDFAPQAFGPQQATTDEDQSLVFSNANVNAISVTDADTNTLTVSLSTTHGTLSLSSVNGLSFSVGDGTNDAAFTFSGSQADINAALNGLTFNPDHDYNGPAEVTYEVSDGNSSTGQNTVAVTVNPVNDAPVLTLNHDEYVQDKFNSRVYDANTGTVNWATNWIESHDGSSHQATTGEIQIVTDPAASSGFQLKLSDLDTEAGVPDTVERTVDLSLASSAILTFDYRRDIPSGQSDDLFPVLISSDGTHFAEIGQIGVDPSQIGPSGTASFVDGQYQTFTYVLPAAYLTNHMTIQFSVGDNVDNGDVVYVDNVAVSYVVSAVNYVENGTPVAIIDANSTIADVDNTTMHSTTIRLTNHQADDALSISGTLPSGITASSYNSTTGVLTLTGNASLADYESALHQVVFSNSSDNPLGGDRIVDITVNDGALDSNTATTMVHVTPVDDAPVATNDNVITNVGVNTFFQIPDWMLLANDTDPDNTTSQLDLAGVSNSDSGLAIHFPISDSVAFVDLGINLRFITIGSGGSFDYTVSDGTLNATGHVNVNQDTQGALDGTSGNDILIGKSSGTTINGNDGNDILFATGGNNMLNGGTGADTFVFAFADNGQGQQVLGYNVINDYHPDEDFLSVDHAIFQSVAEVLSSAQDVSGSVVITANDPNHGTITLHNVTVADLNTHQDHILIA